MGHGVIGVGRFRRRLIIDGPDGVGKTTICKLLAERLRIPIIKMPNMKEYFEKGLTEEFSKLFNETVVQFARYPFILDRGFTSSLVYSKVYGRESVDLSYLYQLEKDLNATTFILTATDHVAFMRRPEDEIIKRQFRTKINREFVKLAAENNYYLINTTPLKAEQVARHILGILKIKSRQHKH